MRSNNVIGVLVDIIWISNDATLTKVKLSTDNMSCTHSSQTCVSSVNRAFVKQWLAGYGKLRHKKCLLLVGPTGCGKSTLAWLCLKELCYSVVEVDASTYRNKKYLEQMLHDATRIPLKQAVLIEDPEALAADGGLQYLVQFCKRGTKLPVVVICGKNKKPRIQQLLPVAELVNFAAMSKSILSERFGVPPAWCVGGDLRQICIKKAGRLPQHDRDRHLDINEAASGLLNGQSVEHGLHLYRVDTQALGNIVHANYAQLVTDIHIAASVANDMSTADMLTDRSDELSMDIAGIIGTVQPGQRVSKCPSKLQPDIVWTKAAFQLARTRAVASAQHAFRAADTYLTIDSIPLVRNQMLELAQSSNWEGLRSWAPDASLQQLTAILRLGFGPKKDTIISRMRRALKKYQAIQRIR